nr:MAG TPA: hypothetical protein [Caudoviricetes sp.]
MSWLCRMKTIKKKKEGTSVKRGYFRCNLA